MSSDIASSQSFWSTCKFVCCCDRADCRDRGVGRVCAVSYEVLAGLSIAGGRGREVLRRCFAGGLTFRGAWGFA